MCDDHQDPTYLDSILASATVQLLRVDECKAPEPRARPVVLVHAGVEPYTSCPREKDTTVIKEAAIEGYRMILSGMDSLDVVERIVRRMENYWVQECKEKAVDFEADSVLIQGDNSKAVVVAGARNHRHPISLAKLLMEKSNAELVVGKEVDLIAEKYGEECGCVDALDKNDENDIGTDCASARNEKDCSEMCEPKEEALNGYEEFELKSFGCLIYSTKSTLHCGKTIFRTSNFGRLSSQACVICCGIHCESGVGCASISGEDRAIYSYAPAMRCVDCMCDGLSIDSVIDQLVEQSNGEKNFAGAGISKDGMPSVYFTGDSFPWAYCESGKVFYGCGKGESMCDKVDVQSC